MKRVLLLGLLAGAGCSNEVIKVAPQEQPASAPVDTPADGTPQEPTPDPDPEPTPATAPLTFPKVLSRGGLTITNPKIVPGLNGRMRRGFGTRIEEFSATRAAIMAELARASLPSKMMSE